MATANIIALVGTTITLALAGIWVWYRMSH